MTALQEQAQSLLAAGRIAEAERCFREMLDADPGSVSALNALCLAALRDGRTAAAVELGERAVMSARDDAMSHFHLGLALESASAGQRAIEALRSAIRLRPEFYIARLHLAAALQRMHDPAATLQFVRALQDANRAGRWLDAAGTPAALRPLVELGVRVVRDERRGAYWQLMQPLIAAHGAKALQRVRRCLAIYLQEAVPNFPDRRQQPMFLYFPELPAMPYFDRKLFAWIDDFEARFGGIKSELQKVMLAREQSEQVFADPSLEKANLRSSRGAPSWTGFYFYRHGIPRADNRSSCPETTAALDALPLSVVRDHGPEVLFSVFTPGTHLLPHRGVTNTRVVAHLPLLVPADCALRVGGEIHSWQEGRTVVFDDTFEHEAWNRSDQVRVVLIFDLWNPYLSAVERVAVKQLVEAIGDYRIATEAA